ncbi:MAG: copper amine oxidase N-terminal domain-containing protein [Desulfotomaculaceae bacterium]|nr:copper amine oxidase N-terminal domain-containing protein [Desulfotomaculaceae bacterium]
MSKKTLFNVALALVLCFSVVFGAKAAQPTAKDLVMASINNFNLGFDKGFYEKCQDVTNLTITEFDGSLTKELGQVKGSSTEFISQLDASKNAIKVSYTTNATGSQHSGDFYLTDDKIIFTKDFFLLLKEFGLDAFENNPDLLEQSPEYLYLSNEQLKSLWEQMLSYQNQELPQEYKDFLLFLVETIPDEYFSLSTSKVTMTLDQDGLEEVIYNLLTKIKDEKERAADLVINLNKYSYEQMGINPEQMRQEIIAGIDKMPVMSREQIKLVSSYVEVKDFTYEASILPGGPKSFKLDLGFNTPDGSVTGQFAAVVDTAGNQENMKGSYDISGSFNNLNGPQVDFSMIASYNYKSEVADSDINIKAVAKNNTTGELLLNLGATAKSTAKVDHSLVVSVPQLDASNSADLKALFPELQQTLAPPVAGATDLQLVVNGNAIETDVNPAIVGSEFVVPARAVLEALGCSVEWVEPNEVHINAGDKTILIIINSKNYEVNGLEKALSAPAYLEADRTMIPASFLFEEFNTDIKLMNNVVFITNNVKQDIVN